MFNVTGKIIEVIDETYDTRTLRLELGEEIDFIPGQYCLVRLIDNERFKENISKPFTFANSPTGKKNFMELTIKKMKNFTVALHSLSVGDVIKIEGPYGKSLNFDESIKEDVVFISGGSGITPFISAIRYSIDKKLPNKILLLNSNRAKEDIIYLKELTKVKNNKDNNVTVINSLSDEWPNDWQGERGRIDKELIEKYVTDPKKKLWYISGPPPMVNAMKELLTNEFNVSNDRLKIETWQIPGKHESD